jgi:capsid protein
LQEFEMLAAKDASETSTVFKLASGEMSVKNLIRNRVGVNTQTPDGTATTAQREEYYQQAIGGRKLILGPGDDAQQFQSNRPSVAVQAFWDYVSARAAAGMGLPLEIIIMRSMQGTMTRAALDMANAFFRCRAAARAESFGRIWEHVIGSTRSLQAGLPVDWRKIRYTPPRSINVDVGRNSNALINEWKAGLRTLEDIAGELGKDWQEILMQRGIELVRSSEIEKQLGLSPGSILGNPPQQPQPPKEGASNG